MPLSALGVLLLGCAPARAAQVSAGPAAQARFAPQVQLGNALESILSDAALPSLVAGSPSDEKLAVLLRRLPASAERPAAAEIRNAPRERFPVEPAAALASVRAALEDIPLSQLQTMPAAELDGAARLIMDRILGERSISGALESFEREHREPLREAGVAEDRLPYVLTPWGAKTRLAVVVAHGMGESPAGMESDARFYLDQGHNVVAPLLDGHGRGNEALEAATVENWNRGLDRAVEFARRLGDEVVLAGFSLGGGLAVQAAGRHKAAGLLLFSPGLMLSQAMIRHFEQRLARGEKWTTDQEILDNPFVNTLLPMRTYPTLMELMRTIQRDFEASVRSGAAPGIPMAIAASEADILLDMGFLRRFAAFHGADLLLYPRAMKLGHADILRPPQSLAAELADFRRRFLARLRKS